MLHAVLFCIEQSNAGILEEIKAVTGVKRTPLSYITLHLRVLGCRVIYRTCHFTSVRRRLVKMCEIIYNAVQYKGFTDIASH